jgi:monoamine oxidase
LALGEDGTAVEFGNLDLEGVGEGVRWAGAEVATRWTGYMDGAIRSGRKAAGEVVASL